MKRIILTSRNRYRKNHDKKQIFTFNNIISIVLLIGLIVLYILFFTTKKSEEPKASHGTAEIRKQGAFCGLCQY